MSMPPPADDPVPGAGGRDPRADTPQLPAHWNATDRPPVLHNPTATPESAWPASGALSYLTIEIPPALPPARNTRKGLWITALVALVAAGGLVIGLRPRHSASEAPAAAAASAAAISSPAGSVVYTSESAHFRARFPAQPTLRELPATVAGTTFTIQVAVVKRPQLAEVESETFSITLPPAQDQEVMRIALTTTAAPGNWTVLNQTPTTFKGKPARTASYVTPQGTRLSGLIFIQSSRQIYALLAASGAVFDDLRTTFTALP